MRYLFLVASICAATAVFSNNGDAASACAQHFSDETCFTTFNR